MECRKSKRGRRSGGRACCSTGAFEDSRCGRQEGRNGVTGNFACSLALRIGDRGRNTTLSRCSAYLSLSICGVLPNVQNTRQRRSHASPPHARGVAPHLLARHAP
eukprot:201742-Chlamydomonas_euryale.AAC.1